MTFGFAPTTAALLVDLSFAQRDQLTAKAVDRPSTTQTSSPSPELIAIDSLLAKLGDQDRQIFWPLPNTKAAPPGPPAWPASGTCRRRPCDRRSIAQCTRLRDGLVNQGFTLTRGENKMSALAHRPTPDKLAGHAACTHNFWLATSIFRLPLSPATCWRGGTTDGGLSHLLRNDFPAGDRARFCTFQGALESHSRARRFERSGARSFLIGTYRWLRQRDNRR